MVFFIIVIKLLAWASFPVRIVDSFYSCLEMHVMTSLKGPGEAQIHDGTIPIPLRANLSNIATLSGSNLRIAIVHARWNTEIISALLVGARKSLLASGVKEENIVIQDVPGSYELPFAVQRLLMTPPMCQLALPIDFFSPESIHPHKLNPQITPLASSQGSRICCRPLL